MTIDRVSYVATEWWLVQWCNADGEDPIKVFGKTLAPQDIAQWPYVRVYLILLAISTFSVFLRTEFAVLGGARAAESIFSSTLRKTLRAKMSFFETVPLGRLLNRFSYDIEQLDIRLSQNMSILMISCSWFCSCVGVIIGVMPLMVCVLAPVVFLYYRLMLFYRKSAVDLQRLDAKARSPVQTVFAELLQTSALESIQVFRVQDFFKSNMCQAVNRSTEALLCYSTAQRWLQVRIDLLGFLVTLAACIGIIVIQGERERARARSSYYYFTNCRIAVNDLLSRLAPA